jgi:hypothetical protein
MKEALKRRRAHGLDLTIVLGSNKMDDQENGDQDGELAPDGGSDDKAEKLDAMAQGADKGPTGGVVNPHDKLDAMLNAGPMGKRNFLKGAMSKGSASC